MDPIFIRITLEEKVQSEVDLSNGWLISVDLQGAHLEGVQLQNVCLHNANLRGAHLKGAQLQKAYLYFTKLQKAWLSETVRVPDYPEDNRTELFEAWASGVKEYQPLWYARFNLTTGVNPHLVRTTLEEKVRLGVDLSYGYLENVDLKGAHLEGAQLQNAYLCNADLRRAHLEGAQLQNIYLCNADLQGAHLEDAQLQCASLSNANLKEAYLKAADLRGVTLSILDFTLPYDCKDEDLMGIYNQCTDQVAKDQLKDILIGKELMMEDWFNAYENLPLEGF